MVILKVINYLKLYRLDVASISFFSYLVGAQLANNLNLQNTAIGLAISLISTNFVYSFNSWADWEIDKTNKPHRPIPSGKLEPKSAFIYSMVLLALSTLYPFLVFKSYFTLVLFLLLPLLGLLYSAHPVRLKRYFILAVLTTSTILIIPILLGYYMNASGTSNLSFFVALFIFCLAVIPLKDIEDIKGDTQHRCQNWYDKLGENRLLSFSLGGLFFDLLLAVIFINMLLRTLLTVFVISTIVVILAFAQSKRNINGLYRTIVSMVVIEGIIAFLILVAGRRFALL